MENAVNPKIFFDVDNEICAWKRNFEKAFAAVESLSMNCDAENYQRLNQLIDIYENIEKKASREFKVACELLQHPTITSFNEVFSQK